MDDYYAFTPVNLALDGTLEQFVVLYRSTWDVYKQLIEEHSELNIIEDEDRKLLNEYAIPIIMTDFQYLAFRRLRIFTTKFKHIHLHSKHFKHFDFFNHGKISYYKRELEWEQQFHKSSIVPTSITFEDIAIDLRVFLDSFRWIVIRAICEEVQAVDSSYTLSQCRKDADDCIKSRMKVRINESLIPKSKDHPPTSDPLFLYTCLNLITCKRNAHELIPTKYYLNHMDGRHTIVLPVHYCKTCKRFLCGTTSFSLFNDFFGKLIVNTKHLSQGANNGWCYEGESELHKMGYNVINGKLSVTQRRNLLISILEGKQLSFFKIVATIEQNIHNFEGNDRMQNAVEKWRSDLRFINEYMLKCDDIEE